MQGERIDSLISPFLRHKLDCTLRGYFSAVDLAHEKPCRIVKERARTEAEIRRDCITGRTLEQDCAEHGFSRVPQIFEWRNAEHLLDRSLVDFLWSLPRERRDDAVEALGDLKAFLSRKQ